jgi:hypothetical protein
VAWRLGELSQHPTWAHVVQRRRWTHCPPVSRHSTQPFPLASLVTMVSRCAQVFGMGSIIVHISGLAWRKMRVSELQRGH